MAFFSLSVVVCADNMLIRVDVLKISTGLGERCEMLIFRGASEALLKSHQRSIWGQGI
jgi:hypothetical protein